MGLTIEKLIAKMKEHQVSLPEYGRGIGGRVLAADLESTLGDFYLSFKYSADPHRKAHCELRRMFVPMKAYRYDKLDEDTKKTVLNDGNHWIAEKKFNGWRVMITYLPYSGFGIWGGNVSDVDFLPVDYTDHVLLAGLHPSDKSFALKHTHPFVIDAEVLCYDDVEGDDGLFSSSTLDAVGIILGGKPERAIEFQREGAELIFECFDCLLPQMKTAREDRDFDNANIPLTFRKEMLEVRLNLVSEISQFHCVEHTTRNKMSFLNNIWSEGDEGIILKEDTKPYVSGSRLRTHAIKVKRTMSGEIGDDIDVFVSGFVRSDFYDEAHKIAGVKLSVFVVDENDDTVRHHIATVTSMPDKIRDRLSFYDIPSQQPQLNDVYYNKVLVVDGQELSNKNRRLQHARVDWERGFRVDKCHYDCIIKLKQIEKERF